MEFTLSTDRSFEAWKVESSVRRQPVMFQKHDSVNMLYDVNFLNH